MNLVPQIGRRSVYSLAEVAEFCGLTERQIRSHVQRGALRKRFSGAYPFDQSDVNQFLTALNCGKVYSAGSKGGRLRSNGNRSATPSAAAPQIVGEHA